MRVYATTGLEPLERVSGPADLLRAGEGWRVYVLDTPGPNDAGRWAAAIGMAALRGATIQKGQTA